MTISLDGFMAGPHQTMEDPLGNGGEDLHQWMFPSDDQAPHEGDAVAREHLGSSEART